MLRNFGIDANHIHFYDNHFTGIDTKVAYRSYAAYGAKSKGWSGTADITDAIDDRKVVEDPDKPLTFFDRK